MRLPVEQLIDNVPIRLIVELRQDASEKRRAGGRRQGVGSVAGDALFGLLGGDAQGPRRKRRGHRFDRLGMPVEC